MFDIILSFYRKYLKYFGEQYKRRADEILVDGKLVEEKSVT